MPKKKRQSVAEKRLKANERQRRRRANMTPFEKEIVAEDHKPYMRRLRQRAGTRKLEHKYQNSYRARKREEKAMAEIEAQEPVADEAEDLDGHQRAQCLLDNL